MISRPQLALCACMLTLALASTEAAAQSRDPSWPNRYGGDDLTASLSVLEREVFEEVHTALSDVGAPPCQSSAHLTAAARRHAQQLLDARTGHRITPGVVRQEVLRAGSVDPVVVPWAVAFTGDPNLEARHDRLMRRFGQRPPTHCGVGVVENEQRSVLVVLGVQRHLWLAPFPSRLARGDRERVQGRLDESFRAPSVMVTTPLGEVINHQTMRRSGHFGAWVDFTGPGRYTVEVMANGPQGPQIVALFPVYVDIETPGDPTSLTVASRSARDEAAPSPAQVLLSLLNSERRSAGLDPLQHDAGLARLAVAHSRDMTRRRYFGHVSPSGEDLTARLERTGLNVARSTENLARSSSPSRAHSQLMESPSHRANLLDRDVTHVGIGAIEHEGELVITQIFVDW